MKKFNLITSIILTVFAFLVFVAGLADILMDWSGSTKWDGMYLMLACIILTQSIDDLVEALTKKDANP